MGPRRSKEPKNPFLSQGRPDKPNRERIQFGKRRRSISQDIDHRLDGATFFQFAARAIIPVRGTGF